MPLSSPGSLTAPQYADVVSFILQKAGAPAGTTELPSKKEALTSIKFVAKKPWARDHPRLSAVSGQI